VSDKNLTGRKALVTGGGRGIGKAISLQLAAAGAVVAVNYSRSAEAAEAVVQEIRAAGGEARAVCFDVADEAAVDAGVKEVVSAFDGLDILVNNAGIAIDGLILRTKSEDWKKILDVNLSGCFYCCRAAAKAMLRSKQGRIINISSVIGEMGNAGQSAYAASKAALFGFTKSLAKELGSRAVTVNAVTPGFITTEMTESMTEEQVAELLKQIPLSRLGDSKDVAALVAFLASADAGYITGEIIAVNGGLHM
jgi:3-oxoacyl-[acyl-carrier protein] reductase